MRSLGGSATVIARLLASAADVEKGARVTTLGCDPESLHAEVDVRTPDEPAVLEQLARSWLQAGLESLATDQTAALDANAPLTTRSLSRHKGAFGEPGTPWGSLVVAPDARSRQASLRAWTPRTWAAFLDAAGALPRRMEVELSRLDEHGAPGDGDRVWLAVQRDNPGYQGWTRLVAHRSPRLTDDAGWEEAAQRWAGFLRDQALGLPVEPAAGFVAEDSGLAPLQTPFERAMDLAPEEVLGTDLLRGYSWVTLIPAGALIRLGGPDALRSSGAFVAVEPLPAGGCLARATERLIDYSDRCVHRVFTAVAAALTPGLPRRFEFDRERRLVYEDATQAQQ